jgi:hypothetical protein
MQPGVHADEKFAEELRERIHVHLLQESSEYRETTLIVGKNAKPHVKLWPYEDPTYFRVGTKQKWVVK